MKYLLLCLSFIANHFCFSQSEFITKILPPSPDAAALGKYGDMPVSTYTGIPNIAVPLFTVEGRTLSLPLSLSYHASGIKVEEIASWVGLGWSLNAGGVVTRSVRGLKDEAASGYIHLSDQSLSAIASCTSELNHSVVMGELDSEPDLFYFNINGLTGKFYFDRQGNVVLENPAFYKIIPTIIGEDITEWKIISDDGTIYLFKDIEVSKSRPIQPGLGDYQFSNSSWFITQIISPDKLDKIDFEYGAFTINIDYSISEQYFTSRNPIGAICGPTINYCPSYGPVRSVVANIIQGKRLSRILSSEYEVTFNANFQRQDISGNALTDIIIKKRSGTSLKSFIFEYDHFPSTRLKLKSVQEVGYFNSALPVYLPKYSFIYNEVKNLPLRTSFAQDYWGFYNEKTANSTLLPRVLYNNNGVYQDLSGGDRTPDEAASKANLLTKIKYPTGGETTFEYEGHTYSWLSPSLITDTLTQEMLVTSDAAPLLLTCEPLGNTVEDIETFTLFNKQVVQISGVISSCQDAAGSLAPTVWINNQSGVIVKQYIVNHAEGLTKNFDEYMELPAGTYSLHARTRYGLTRASGGVRYKKFTGTSHVRKAGGVRIKRVISSSGNHMPDLVKEYSYANSDGTSNGVLVSKPIYEHYQTSERSGECTGVNGQQPVFYNCDYYVRSSHTQIAMSTTSGSHIGYKQVTITNSNNGKEVFSYTSAIEHPDTGAESYPFVAKTSNDWARGQLVNHEVYAENGTLIERKVNKYSLNVLSYLEGFVVRRVNPANNAFKVFQCKQYLQLITQSSLDSAIREQFNGLEKLKFTTAYKYDSIKHVLPKVVTELTSKGEAQVKFYRYPFEYNYIAGLTTAEKNALIRLDADNVKSIQIEIKDNVNSKIKSTIRSDYSIISIANPDFPQVSSGVYLTDRKSSVGNSPLIVDELFRNYNNQGNPQEYESRKGLVNAIIWSKRGKVVANVELSMSGEVGYAGFEEDDLPFGWVVPNSYSTSFKTGARCFIFSNSNSVVRNNLNSTQKYIVSYWAKNGVPNLSGSTNYNDALNPDSDGWKYYEKLINGSTSVVLTGVNGVLIDEVRLYPLGAKMTTYTYSAFTGIASSTDYNNLTTYFEYDAFSRLKMIKDHKSNIVRAIDYYYKAN